MTSKKDSRGTIRVTIGTLNDFRMEHHIVYASDVVHIDGVDRSWILSLSMAKKFVVSMEEYMMYNGPNANEAVRIFNLDVKEIKKLWYKREI